VACGAVVADASAGEEAHGLNSRPIAAGCYLSAGLDFGCRAGGLAGFSVGCDDMRFVAITAQRQG
jgi:hypothetical protein